MNSGTLVAPIAAISLATIMMRDKSAIRNAHQDAFVSTTTLEMEASNAFPEKTALKSHEKLKSGKAICILICSFVYFILFDI